MVELLVVIGILGMLLGIVTIGWNAIAAGSKVQSAVIQLRGTISWARQYAITHRDKVYIVFPELSPNTIYPTYPATNWANIMPYQAYSVFVPGKGYIREWQFLPKGVVFDPTYVATTEHLKERAGINVFSKTEYTRFTVAQPGTTNVAPPELACIAFLPNGRLNQLGGTEVGLYLREGSVNEAIPGPPLFVPSRTVYCLSIRPLTGQIRLWEF